MAYRNLPEHKPNLHRDMTLATTGNHLHMQNGTIGYFAVPCWYVEILPPKRTVPHNRHHHDFIGWPNPGRTDHICQAWDFANSCCRRDRSIRHCPGDCAHYIDMRRMIPIHLTEEGYTSIDIELDELAVGVGTLDVDAWIDERDDWVVRFSVKAYTEEAIDNKVGVPYSIFANGTRDYRGKSYPVRDMIQKGMLTILPSVTYYEGDE